MTADPGPGRDADPALTDADRALLAAEGVLIDFDALLRRAWDARQAAAGHPPGDELYLPIEDDRSFDAIELRASLDVALRAAGLVPGEPVEHLLLAAIRRRGWYAALTQYRDGSCHVVVLRTRDEGRSALACLPGNHVGRADDPATALAAALCQAVRATEG